MPLKKNLIKIKEIISKFFKPGDSLYERAISGGFWAFALRFSARAFSFVRTIILARILAPKDFGLFGIALLTFSILETFSNIGIYPALIQKKEKIEPYLDTAWTMSVFRGLFIALLLFISAPLVSRFFNESSALWLIRALAISQILTGFTNIGTVFFLKEIELQKSFVINFAGTIADFVVAVPFAIILKNAWALILGSIASSFVKLVISHIIHPYKPRLKFHIDKAKELYSYGKYIFFRTIVTFFLTQGDDIFVGKFLGVASLGFYQIAYRFSNLAATEITHTAAQVSFPAFSKIQDEKVRLIKALRRVMGVITLVSYPVAASVFALAGEFTRIFLGTKWLPMVPTMQVLCLFGALRSTGANFGPLYNATGKVDIPLNTSLINLFVMLATIYPLSRKWGIFGAALSVNIYIFLGFIIYSVVTQKVFQINVLSLYKSPFLSLIASIILILFYYALKTYLLDINSVFTFLIMVLAGALFYLFLRLVVLGGIERKWSV